jgi:predicted ATP-grasp superfamily ATP-dependent carboligase
MNILFVGGGRRLELARQFTKRGYTVHGYELDIDVPLAAEYEVYTGLPWDDPHIERHLKAFIDDMNCLMLPLQDAAIPILANMGDYRCITSSRLASHICYDKKKLEEFMMHNFPMFYPSCSVGNRGYVLKPRHGFSSKDIRKVPVTVLDSDVAQELIIGKEYTVDAYFTKGHHKMVGAVPRIRTRVAGGEVIDSTTVDCPQLINITRMIGEQLCLSGPSCFQYIKEKGTQKPYLIEINARFGGGSTLSIHSGFDMIDMITTEYVKELQIDRPYDWQADVRMQRSMRDYFSGGEDV